MNLAPVVLFVYNRPEHTLNILKSLATNELFKSSTLHVYADGAKEDANEDDLKKIQQTRNILKQKVWCKELHVKESEKNNGLANSIIEGVTEVVNKYGKVIVLEDDLIVSPFFLNYMNDSLVRYDHDMRVGQIGACNFFANGDMYPKQFFIPIPDSLGWGVWKNRWNHFNPDAQELLNLLKKDSKKMSVFNAYNAYNFEDMLNSQIKGIVNSWAIRWQAVCVLNNWLTLYPNNSMTNHVQSIEATHANFNILPPLQLEKPNFQTIEVKILPDIIKAMKLGYAAYKENHEKKLQKNLPRHYLLKTRTLISKLLPLVFIRFLKKHIPFLF